MEKEPEVKKALASLKCTSLEAKKQNQWNDTDKAALAVVIGQIFDVQKQYGKTSGQLQSAVELFSWVLSDYPVELVIWGIGEYLRRKSDMPTPADICQIIDPKPPAASFDKSLYITLKQLIKEQGQFALDNEEIEFVKQYEMHMLKASQS